VERPQKPIECLFKYKKTSRSKAIKYVTKEWKKVRNERIFNN
jgi:hypothetical protein